MVFPEKRRAHFLVPNIEVVIGPQDCDEDLMVRKFPLGPEGLAQGCRMSELLLIPKKSGIGEDLYCCCLLSNSQVERKC